jgi:hypothetical protein
LCGFAQGRVAPKGTRKREQLSPGVGDSALCTMSEFDPFDSLSVSRQVHNFMHVNLLPSDSHPGIAQQSYGESCSLFIGESRELPPGTTRFVSNPWGVSSFPSCGNELLGNYGIGSTNSTGTTSSFTLPQILHSQVPLPVPSVEDWSFSVEPCSLPVSDLDLVRSVDTLWLKISLI